MTRRDLERIHSLCVSAFIVCFVMLFLTGVLIASGIPVHVLGLFPLGATTALGFAVITIGVYLDLNGSHQR